MNKFGSVLVEIFPFLIFVAALVIGVSIGATSQKIKFRKIFDLALIRIQTEVLSRTDKLAMLDQLDFIFKKMKGGK